MPEQPVDLDGERQDYRRGPAWHAQQANARKEWQQLRDLAVTVPCRDCGMPKGAACVTRRPGEKPEILQRFPAHASRISDARKASR